MPTASPEVQPPVDQIAQTPTAASNSSRSHSTRSPVCRALSVFADNDLVAPEHDHLEMIARFAVQAQWLFFAAAMHAPDEDQLNHFFNEFVLACALPAQTS
jgi:hypothetical protein